MSIPRFKPITHQGSNTQMCCISFNSTDCIRLIGVPALLTNALRSAIENSWGEIKKEKDYHGAYEFKMKGHPWNVGGEDTVRARVLLTSTLACMAKNGWFLIQSVDTTKKASDKDALFFEYDQPDPEVMLFAVSFNSDDKIRLIGAPSFMKNIMKQACEMHTTVSRERDYGGSYEIKLVGSPWWSQGEDGVATKLLLCQILANFKGAGYRLYASVDISYGGENVGDLESWVFRKISPLWQ